MAQKLQAALYKCAKTMGSFSYGTNVFPYSEEVDFAEKQVYRSASLPQWPVERENFEKSVLDGYSKLQPGKPKQLVAGTGVGKSTVMPAHIAHSTGEVGVVIMPEDMMAFLTQAYVNKMLVPKYPGLNVNVLRSSDSKYPLSAPALYYTSGADLLSRIARFPGFLNAIGATFLCLDESHADVPDYNTFVRLVDAGVIPKLKLFYASATVVSDINMEAGGIGRQVVEKPAAMYPIRAPQTTPTSSPMHFRNIDRRTVVFLPNDEMIDAWYDYYTQHDVRAIKFGFASSSKDIVTVSEQLETPGCTVLLTTSRLQTSYTLPLEQVIDPGYTQDFVMSEDFTSGKLIVRPETVVERTQRAGRVGRHMAGKVFQSDLELSPAGITKSSVKMFYEYLWCIVFNLKVRDPAISDFATLTGKLSREAAALMLHSRIPACLILPYVGNSGYYKGFGTSVGKFTYTPVEMPSFEDIVDRTQEWPVFSTGPRTWVDTPSEYASLVEYPKEWSCVPYFVWRVYNDQDFVRAFRANDDGRSVISVVPDRAKVTRATSSVSYAASAVSGHRKQSSHDYAALRRQVGSRITLKPEDFTQDDYQRNAPYELQPDSSFVAPKVLTYDSPEHAALMSPSKVTSWMREIPMSVERPVIDGDTKSKRSSGSSGSHERNELPLKRVDPVVYKMFKLYPMDSKLCKSFVNSDRHAFRDAYMSYENLVRGKRIFSELNPETQGVYFKDILHIHNMRLAAKLQMSAGGERSKIRRLEININGVSITSSESMIATTAALLKAFELERYYVGIDMRAKHTGLVSSMDVSPTFEFQQARARVALAWGDKRVADEIAFFSKQVHTIHDDDGLLGHYAHIGDYLYLPEHVFSVAEKLVVHDSVVFCDTLADLTVLRSLHAEPARLIRAPVHGESVYVLGWDISRAEVVPHGPYKVIDNDPLWIIDSTFGPGYSGAVIVAASDCAALALYTSWYESVGDVEYSVVSALIEAKFEISV